MTLKKILIVSGTHGNEINPVWAINQFNKQFETIDKNIEYKFIELLSCDFMASPEDTVR